MFLLGARAPLCKAPFSKFIRDRPIDRWIHLRLDQNEWIRLWLTVGKRFDASENKAALIRSVHARRRRETHHVENEDTAYAKRSSLHHRLFLRTKCDGKESYLQKIDLFVSCGI